MVKQSHYRPGQAQRVPGAWGSQVSRRSVHEGGRVVSPTHRSPLPPQETFLVLITSMKNSNDTLGNRTRDVPACSTVPQPTAPPAACPHIIQCHKISQNCKHTWSRPFCGIILHILPYTQLLTAQKVDVNYIKLKIIKVLLHWSYGWSSPLCLYKLYLA